jgi:serine/threonine protein kinase
MATTNTEWFRDQTSLLGELQRVHKSRSGPPTIPGYDDLRELQRGGQGVVYAGTQKSTRRKVGIKVLLDGAFASDVSRRRFEREIDLVASLRHPNIVSIYDCGMTPAPDQRPYFVMEYIDGVTLNEHTEAMRSAEANGIDHHRPPDNGDHLAMTSVSGIAIDDDDMARPLLPLSHVTMQGVLRLFAVVCDAVN